MSKSISELMVEAKEQNPAMTREELTQLVWSTSELAVYSYISMHAQAVVLAFESRQQDFAKLQKKLCAAEKDTELLDILKNKERLAREMLENQKLLDGMQL
jgi:hypothetical protein